MVEHCFAYGCSNGSNNPACAGLSWHSLPLNDPALLRVWLVKIKRTNTPVTKNSYICGNHFEADCLIRPTGSKRTILKPGSSPTKFDFSEVKAKRKAPKDRTTPGNNAVRHLRKPAVRRPLKLSAPFNGTAGENVEILPASKEHLSDKENEQSQH